MSNLPAILSAVNPFVKGAQLSDVRIVPWSSVSFKGERFRLTYEISDSFDTGADAPTARNMTVPKGMLIADALSEIHGKSLVIEIHTVEDC